MSHPIAELGEAGRALLRELLREHRRLHEVVLQLHDKHHRVSMEVRGRLSHGGLPPVPPPSLGGLGGMWLVGGVLRSPSGLTWPISLGSVLYGLTWPTSLCNDSLWVDLADIPIMIPYGLTWPTSLCNDSLWVDLVTIPMTILYRLTWPTSLCNDSLWVDLANIPV